MVDVRLPGFAFSFLVGVLFGGKMGSGKNCVELVVGVGHFSVWHIWLKVAGGLPLQKCRVNLQASRPQASA
jgi:hypothetical protein